MKYITEYRDKELAKKLVADIAKEARADKNYRLMEFCGGHTHVISRYGLEGILPKNVRMIHGPGCPVCVMPIGRIDSAIELALEHGVILCTYADTMRVPASKGLSLMKAKAQGGDIRMIYSAADCLDIARANPDKNVVFFAIGFETTTPATAVVLKQAKAEGLKNFFVFCNHVLTPPAMRHILKNQEKVKLKVCRTCPCFYDHRQRTLRNVRQGLFQTGCDRRVRTLGHASVHPHADSSNQSRRSQG